MQLEHVSGRSFEIRVWCHGKEDFCKVEFPYHIPGDMLEDERANWAVKRASADFCAFDPAHVLDTAKK